MVLRFLAKKLLIAYLNFRTKSKISYAAHVNHKTKLEGSNTLHCKSVLSGSEIGFASFVGAASILPNSKIGRYCSIANNVELISHTHPSSEFVSTHPSFYSLLKQSGFTFVGTQKFNENLSVNDAGIRTTEIGNDVWIGAHVLIMGGVRIGDGAIVAAGAVVTRDVPPYSIVGGVPAKKIRMRFSEDQIRYLICLRWWERDYSWLVKNAKYFHNIESMMAYVSNVPQ